MAAKNTLRARLELLGGKEIVGQFHAIESAAKKGFDTIEREAKEATRDVRDLERELAKLEAMSKSIRASIKVKKGGSLTSEQQQALAFAKQLDNQAASMRQQIQAANDTLRMGGGNALRTLAGNADKDLLGVAKSAAEIDDAVANLRNNGGLGGLISDDQLDKLSAISKSLDNERVRYGEGLENRVERADAADIAKENRRVESERKEKERFDKRQTAIADAKAAARILDDAHEAERERRRDENEQRREAERDRKREEREKIREREKEQKAAKKHAQKQADDVIEEIIRVRKAKEEDDRREAERRQKQRDEEALAARHARIARAYRDNGVRSVARADRDSIEAELSKEADKQDHIRLRREIAKSLRPDLFPDDVDAATRKLKKSAKDMDDIGGIFSKSGKLITGTAGSISKGLKGSAGDVGKFVSALEGLSTAVGSAALRTGIAGLLAALAGGLAALGGGAVLAGIAAIAGLAGWDATKIANAAKSVGTSLETFSTMRYGAQASGVEFDDYAAAMQALRASMVDSITMDKKTGKHSGGVLFDNAFGKVMASDDGGATLRDTADVLKDIADIYNRLGSQDLKNAFLDQFGGQANELRAMIPFLEKGSAGMSELQKEARRLGVELDQKLVDDMEVLNREVFKLWNVFRSIAYSIGREVLPVLKPVMDQINDFLIGNRDAIASGAVSTFNYLIQTIKDFYTLWTTSGRGIVEQDWTKTIYDGVESVVNVFKLLWSGISNGYSLAEPTLTKISDYFGLGGPLEVALLLAGGWVLGFFEVFTKGSKVATAAFRVISGLLSGLMIGPLGTILGSVAAIVGWPLLLGTGVALVAAYWDDIGGLFTKAWEMFKTTFPETAKWLEDAFGPALQSAKDFTSKMLSDFQQKFPKLTGILKSLKDNLAGGANWLIDLDWSGIFTGLKDASVATLDWLAGILERISPLLGQIGTAIKQILGGAMQFTQYLWENGGKDAAKGGGAANADAITQGAEVLGDTDKLKGVWDLFTGRSMRDLGAAILYEHGGATAQNIGGLFGVATPTWEETPSAATQGTPFSINIEGQRIIMATTPDPNAGARLSESMAAGSRARIVK